MRKLKNNELGRITVDAFKAIEKTPLIVVLDNIRSLNNIGSVFRTADAFLIEKINILHASLLAMKRAILRLKTKPSLVLIDGNKLPDLKNYKLKYVIKGDQKIPSISAASIIAKVSRDKFITKLSKEFKKAEPQLDDVYFIALKEDQENLINS